MEISRSNHGSHNTTENRRRAQSCQDELVYSLHREISSENVSFAPIWVYRTPLGQRRLATI